MLRKVMIVILMIVILYSLIGCIPVIIDEYYEIYQETDQIKSIALYQRNDSPNAETNELNETPLAEIAPEDFSEFVAELEGIYSSTGFYITIAAQDPSFYFDKYVIRIHYLNGDQEFISDGGYQEVMYSDETVDGSHYSFDDDQWDAFILKYFSVKRET